jgi:hypothetical protein
MVSLADEKKAIAATEDYLSTGAEGFSGNPHAERIIERSAEALMGVYRVIKNMLVHDPDNEAVVQTLEMSHRILIDFGQLVGNRITITFVFDTIFVSGELLKAARGIYESATELGQLLARVGVSEVSLDQELTLDQLKSFGMAVAHSLASPHNRGYLLETKLEGVTTRRVNNVLERKESDESLDPRQRILRLYASALVVLRAYFDGIAEGNNPAPVRLKRVAQRLVQLAETGDPALLGMTTMANAHRDDAGRALQAAILAISIGRQITHDRVTLSHLAMAALLADVGRTRILGDSGRGKLIPLTPQQRDEVPATASAICIANSGVSALSAERCVIIYETNWTENQDRLGPVYNKRLPTTVQSRLLRMVRSLLDHLAPRDTTKPKSPVDALQGVLKTPGLDKVMRRILVAAIGLIPTGSVVEFETGQWGVVIGPSLNKKAINQPRVRIITDGNGVPMENPVEYDLGRPTPGRAFPAIVNIIDPGKVEVNNTNAFMR